MLFLESPQIWNRSSYPPGSHQAERRDLDYPLPVFGLMTKIDHTVITKLVY